MNAPVSAPASAPTTQTRSQARRQGLTLIAVAVLLGGAGWGGWHWMTGRHYQTTDNAYVAGNVIQITPQVGGTVVSILADDTDTVAAGQPLTPPGCRTTASTSAATAGRGSVPRRR